MDERMGKERSATERRRLLELAKAARLERHPAARVSIPPAPSTGPLPLSFGQRRLWFLSQLQGGSASYHIPLSFKLRGTLDRWALRRALDRIVARHGALRTTFYELDGEPYQRIAPEEESPFLLLEDDLRAQPGSELQSIMALEASAPFDLERGPVIRGRLLQTADEEHTLLITLHHIVSDGWSMGIFLHELGALYAAFHAGAEDPLPSPALRYVDFAAWQRSLASGHRLQEQADYWRSTLEGAPRVLELPCDHPRPAQQDYNGAFIPFHLDADLTESLKALSRRQGTTLFMTLLAGWAALLSRLSGQDDLVVGTPTANRGHADLEGIIGFFVNTLALRIDVSGDPSVAKFLQRVKTQTLAAHQHSDIPFERVVEVARPSRSLAHSPLFQVMFAWQNGDEGGLEMPGLLQLPALQAATTTAKFDLTLTLEEGGGIIQGGVEYATALFEADTIERILGHLRTLLQGMAADDAQAVGRLPILTPPELHQVLVDWNATQAVVLGNPCLHELFESQVEATPEARAVVQENRALSYLELKTQSNRLAHHLAALGVGPGDAVAILMERSIELVVAQLAILSCGGCYVPLDRTFPVERTEFMIRDCGARVLLTLPGQVWPEMAGVTQVELHPSLLEQGSSAPPRLAIDDEAIAYIMYTSGSTGMPKGVRVPHRAVRRLAIQNGFAAFSAEDRVAFAANPAFDAATLEVWAPLLNGGTLVVVPPSTLLDPTLFGEALRRHQISVLWLTVGFFNQVADLLGEEFSRLRYLMVGGDALDAGVIGRLLRHHPPQHLLNGYGPTETTTFATTYEITAVPGGATSIPIGRPIANTSVYILDKHLQPVPVGVSGELYIGGAGVALGYLNRPELTAERFLEDPFSSAPGARMYRTGDLARWLPDGAIEFLGRNDFQVKIRGFRIELGEIEAALGSQTGIQGAVVLAREDVPGDKRLVGYYTASEPFSAEALRARLAAVLPEYMVPSAFVHLETLPLTPNGKLDRKALPAPDVGTCPARSLEPPQGDCETLVAGAWRSLLNLEWVGRQDNFFDLGGHSLLAIRLVHRLEEAGLSMTVADLFSHPTLASLAAHLEHQDSETAGDSPIFIRQGGMGRPLFLIHDGFGDITYAHRLAAHLDAEIPVVGLPCWPVHLDPPSGVPEMAARLMGMMRAAQPEGPYRIAGWSLGGTLAFEMATQLSQKDERVDFLGLMDSHYLVNSDGASETIPMDDKAALLMHIAPLAMLEEDHRSFDAVSRAAENMDFHGLFEHCKTLSLLPRHATSHGIRPHLNRLQALVRAHHTYVARPIRTPIHLFTASGQEGVSPLRGWEAIHPGIQVNPFPVPGTHFSMMRAPHIAALGGSLSQAILRAQEPRGNPEAAMGGGS